jgi:hypothetical protein
MRSCGIDSSVLIYGGLSTSRKLHTLPHTELVYISWRRSSAAGFSPPSTRHHMITLSPLAEYTTPGKWQSLPAIYTSGMQLGRINRVNITLITVFVMSVEHGVGVTERTLILNVGCQRLWKIGEHDQRSLTAVGNESGSVQKRHIV